METKDEQILEAELVILKTIGFTDEMLEYRRNWIKGYKEYHNLTIVSAIEEARDRWDSYRHEITAKSVLNVYGIRI
jgi:hypothetical protein